MSLNRVKKNKKVIYLEQVTEDTLEELLEMDKAFLDTQIKYLASYKLFKGIDHRLFMCGPEKVSDKPFPVESFYFIKDGDTIVGHVEYYIEQETVSISTLYVKEEYRGQGYGTWCIDYIKAEGKSKRAKIITIGVYLSKVAAERLYSKLGFEPYHQAMVGRL
jgi:ribosomal protein S18 acetylase RimI-like enzyme